MGRTATLDFHVLQIRLLKIHVLQIGFLQTHFLLILSSPDFTICPVPGLREDVFLVVTGQPEIHLRSQATHQPRPQGKESTLGIRLGRDKLSIGQVKARTLCKCVRFGLVAEPWSLGARGISTTTTRHFRRGWCCTRIGTSLSDPLTITHGVPQGSILSPLYMFTLYMNDLLR